MTLDLQGEPEADAPVRQFVWGSRYIDEIVCMDVDTNSDGDCLDAGGSARYHYLQDANWNVVAVREGADVIERYEYDQYGTCRIYAGWNAAEGREDLTVIGASRIDNPIRYAGYPFDAETELYHVRHRMYSPSLQRWLQRDPMEYVDGLDMYAYVAGGPITATDPQGLLLRAGSPSEGSWERCAEYWTKKPGVPGTEDKINSVLKDRSGCLDHVKSTRKFKECAAKALGGDLAKKFLRMLGQIVCCVRGAGGNSSIDPCGQAAQRSSVSEEVCRDCGGRAECVDGISARNPLSKLEHETNCCNEKLPSDF